ncbi:MAG TPA: alkaline phosphatase D family protein [Burkholderiales bacterium]|nr:alkaline phosphatase D family protein [Burkholderiales bacterium]
MSARRRFLASLGGLGLAAVLPRTAQSKPRFAVDPYALGVASGYPSAGGVVLWTRLVGDLDPAPIRVRWEVALDESMRHVVASGVESATPEWAHSVHVEVRGLAPARHYWYRFMSGDAVSPVGRTGTAPRRDARVDRLRFAFASCQQYEQGYYGAWRHAVADDPELIVFLGDYIYESSWGRDHVRAQDPGEPYSLDEYRMRYACYKSDPDLQAAHAACPWLVTWDDHEVDNDYAADRSEDGMPRGRFLARRAAAYRAYYEHMPLPARMRPQGPHMRIYTQLGWGSLARLFMLDDRQYRAYQVCPRRHGGGNVVRDAECPARGEPGRSMLGAQQEAWLERAFAGSRAGWNIVAQQTLMAQFARGTGAARRFWTDGWDGYPAARRKLLESMARQRLANPVVIGGDVHFHAVADLKTDFDDPAAPVLASELCGTSITSQARAQAELDAVRADNPHVKLADGRYRGYVRAELRTHALQADLRAMATVRTRDAACTTLASFVVEDGRAGPQRA